MKNRILIFLLITAPLFGFGQENFTLHITTPQPKETEKAYLVYQVEGLAVQDSAVLNAGHYSFKGNIPEPVLARLFIGTTSRTASKSAFSTAVWLENGTVQIFWTGENTTATVKGGKINSSYQELEASKEPDRAKISQLTGNFAKATAEQKKSAVFMKNYFADMKLAMHGSFVRDSIFIIKHPGSYLSLYLISNTVSFSSPKVLEDKLQRLSPSLRRSYLAKQIEKTVNVLKSRAVGGTAPNFSLKNDKGKTVSLAQFRGKYVLLDFWASWCVPCRKENPNLKLAYEKFSKGNFDILSVSLDRPAANEKWLEAIKADGLNWTQLRCENEGGNEVELLYNVLSIPMNFLINPSGKIVALNLRGDDLQKKLAELIRLNKTTK